VPFGQTPGGVGVSAISKSISHSDLEDLDAAATAYAQAWETATARRRTQLRDDLICHCLPFAGRMARRYTGRGEPIEDLRQVARIGLINAIDRYNPARGSFTAFAVITVCGELKRHFRDKTWGLHVNRRLQDLAVELQHAVMVLTNTLQRAPSETELAQHLGVTEEQVRRARLCGASYTPVPLSTPTGNDGSLEMGDAFGTPDPDLETLPDRLAVSELMHLLPERIQRMLALRFYGNLTQAQIAAEFDVSQMHVSRLLIRGLTWLRAAMVSDTPPPWMAREDIVQQDDMRVRVSRAAGVVTVRVSGEVDRDTAGRLRLSLRSAVASAAAGRLIVDLSGMPLADAAAVAVLRDACVAAALAHVPVALRGVQAHVAPVIAALGLPLSQD
jgi:RNA polymerase sigma-B factor